LPPSEPLPKTLLDVANCTLFLRKQLTAMIRKNALPIAKFERCDSLDGHGTANPGTVNTFIVFYRCGNCGRCSISMLYIDDIRVVQLFAMEVGTPSSACTEVGFPYVEFKCG